MTTTGKADIENHKRPFCPAADLDYFTEGPWRLQSLVVPKWQGLKEVPLQSSEVPQWQGSVVPQSQGFVVAQSQGPAPRIIDAGGGKHCILEHQLASLSPALAKMESPSVKKNHLK